MGSSTHSTTLRAGSAQDSKVKCCVPAVLRDKTSRGDSKIQDSKLLMILSGSLVIRFGGFDFVSELTDGSDFIVVAYLDLPFLISF